MLEPGSKFDLPLETLGAEGGSQLRMQDLQRDWPVVPEVVGQIDGGHAATPKLSIDAVPIRKVALELLGEFCHFRA